MAYLGSWAINDWIVFYCNTHTAATGAATDADAVPSYRVYEEETGAAIANGNMALLDAANTVGFYSERIQLLAATGFEKGKQYAIYISATVATIEGTVHHTFQIEAEVDANTVSGNVPAVVGNVGGNVVGSVGSVAAGGIAAAAFAAGAIDSGALAASAANEIRDAILDDATRFSGADIDIAISTRAVEANVQGHATAALNAYDSPTKAELDAAVLAIRGADGDTLETLSDQLDVAQADLDNPDQYKADVSGLATAAALATVDANVDAVLADTGTDGVAISTATMQAIADETLKRGVSNVEDAADDTSLAELVLAGFEWALVGTTWTIRKTDGTTFNTRTVTVDASANPVTGVT